MEFPSVSDEIVLVPSVPRHKKISRVAVTSDPEESQRISDDGEYMKRVFTEAGDWVGEYGGWGVTLKRGPYTERDLMIIKNGEDTHVPVGVDDLDVAQAYLLLKMCERYRNRLNRVFGGLGANFVIGLNRGKTQSLKRVHAHITDESLVGPVNGVDMAERQRLLSMVSVTRGMMEATERFKDEILAGVADLGINADCVQGAFPCKIRLERGGIASSTYLIRELFVIAEKVRAELDGEVNGGGLWSYSVLMNGSKKKPVVSFGFSDKSFGVAEMMGIAIERVPGEYSPEHIEIRKRFKMVLKYIHGDFKKRGE